MKLAWKVDEGSKVNLKEYKPGIIDQSSDHASAQAELEDLSNELSELQELLRHLHSENWLMIFCGVFIGSHQLRV